MTATTTKTPTTNTVLDTEYDAIIIGAGMSGLAAGIRLSMFEKRVCILEMHSVPGGLNSFYRRGKRNFDVGLHALTNFSQKSERKNPLNRLLRQLRIGYDDLHLQEQWKSKVLFPQEELAFSNDFQLLQSEVTRVFPHEQLGFDRLVSFLKSYNELNLDLPYQSAKEKVREFIRDELLVEMIFCPLLIYGSAWENDMDFSQFAIMFKSIFMEGFSRPEGGVRTIIDLLLKRFAEEGGDLQFKKKVEKIITKNKKFVEVELNSGETLRAPQLFSSIGYPETMALCSERQESSERRGEGQSMPRPGHLSFVETIMTLKNPIPKKYFQQTILFYNNRLKYRYCRPETLVDAQSAVVCFPDNYGPYSERDSDREGEGQVRVTLLANYDLWKNLLDQNKKSYLEEKEKVFESSLEIAKRCIPHYPLPLQDQIVFKDVFTPTTITRYTGHWCGAVYGSPDKSRRGETPYRGLYLCGTDQGFLGIVGAMLSGISMANLHGLGGAGTLSREVGGSL